MEINKLNQFKVIILCGLPGSGKSTLAKKISTELNAVHISSDQIRLNIFKVGTHRAAHDPKVEAVGSDVYLTMAHHAIKAIESESKVVLDATFMDQKRDTVLNNLLEKIGSKDICFVVIEKTIKEIEKVLSKGDPKDFKGWKDLMGHWQPRFESGEIGYPTKDYYPEIEIFRI